MRWTSDQFDVVNLQAQARAAILWWLRELRALIPEPLLLRLHKPEHVLFIDLVDRDVILRVEGEAQSFDVGRIAADLLEAALPPSAIVERLWRTAEFDDVIIRLPHEKLLRKVVQLPLAAERRLRPILANEIERQTPLDAGQVYFDYRVLDRNKAARSLTVELVIVKREIAERARRIAVWLGTAPTGIAVLDVLHRGQPYRLLPDRSSSRGKWFDRWLTPALAIFLAVLVLATTTIGIWRRRVAEEAMALQVRQLRSEVQTTMQLRKDVDDAAEQIEFLSRQRTRPRLLQVASEVTRLLPDGTWLFDLELDGGEVHVRGYSPDASKLVTAFDGSSIFGKAQFKAPLTQAGRSGLERFDLSLELKGAGRE